MEKSIPGVRSSTYSSPELINLEAHKQFIENIFGMLHKKPRRTSRLTQKFGVIISNTLSNK